MKYPMQYVRTDRNGTKYFYDWNCPRCGGAGEADKWQMTGRICYACGGTGKRAKAMIVKEYTEEHAAKLEAKRLAKAQKVAEETRRYNEEHAEEIEAENRRIIERRYAEYGCGKDGVGYVLKGNTYPIKEQIKKNGGRWIYGVWVCPINVEAEGVKAYKIDLSGHIGSGSQEWLNGYDFLDTLEAINA